MTQKIHNSNHINIKIVNTKTKKRKSKHRKHALAQHSYAATPHMPHSITPFFNYPAPPSLTNKPYYVETNSQLQLKDADKPKSTAIRDFDTLPPLPQFEHDEQSSYHHHNDARDDMSDVSARTNRHHSNYLNLSSLYPDQHQTENFYNPLNFHDHSTVKEPEFHDQSREIHEPAPTITRAEYEHQIKLQGRRVNYAEKAAPHKEAKAQQKQTKNEQITQQKQEKAEQTAKLKQEKEEQKAQMKQEKAEQVAKAKEQKASSIPVRSKKKK